MYKSMYAWADDNFIMLATAIILFLFIFMILAVIYEKSGFMKFCWKFFLIGYLVTLVIVTLASRNRLAQPMLVRKISFHYVFISRPDTGFMWEDFANVLMFVPYGVLLRNFIGKVHRWYGAVLAVIVAAITSASIEAIQYVLRCGCTDINDLLNNICGAVAGYIVFAVVDRGINACRRLAIIINGK